MNIIIDTVNYISDNREIDKGRVLEIAAAGVVILTCIWKIMIYVKEKIKLSRIEKELPGISYIELKEIKKYFIPTKYQSVNPARYDELSEKNESIPKWSLIDYFIKKGLTGKISNQYYLVLGDSGMGKTTFLINLYIKYKSKFSLLGNRPKIIYLPLSMPDIDKQISEIRETRSTILLLDAFDEDPKAVANYQDRLKELTLETAKFRKVVMTCRTQFFSSETAEPSETTIRSLNPRKGYHEFFKLYISPFDSQEIKTYLRRKFPLDFKKRRRGFKIVKRSNYIMVRPMLLSYIDLLVDSNVPYTYSFQIYGVLVDEWIKREAKIKKADERLNYEKELRKFSIAVAEYIYINRNKSGGYYISENEILGFSKLYNINLNDMEMKSRSLLNRNEEGQYKFSHKSILEFLLAELIVWKNNDEFGKKFNFDAMDMTKQFYDEMYFLSKTIPLLIAKRDKGIDFKVYEPLDLRLLNTKPLFSLSLGFKKEKREKIPLLKKKIIKMPLKLMHQI